MHIIFYLLCQKLVILSAVYIPLHSHMQQCIHVHVVVCTTVNTHFSTTIRFQRIWLINEFGGLTGYLLVLVHYIGTGKLWQIRRFGR